MARRSQPWALQWPDVDPDQFPVSADDLAHLRTSLLAVAAQKSEQAFDDVVADHFGAWSGGWRWCRDEGSIGGGVVSGWCCETHSMKGAPDVVVDRVLAGLADWRAWLVHLSSLFAQLEPRPTESADVDAIVARAVTVVLAEVADATSCGDAWYTHAQQALRWYLQRWGVSDDDASSAVARACKGVFSSWSDLGDDVRARVGDDVAHLVRGRLTSLQADDVLLRHRALRAALDPAWAPAPLTAKAAGVDGHAVYIDVVDAERDRDRAARMREALRVARALASTGALVDLELLRSLHAIAVPKSEQGFRSGAAYAKDGRERYGFDDGVIAACDAALVDANDVAVSVVFRAGRAYLDVCFFHPFVDGNARAARLIFDLILAREGVVLRDVDALFRHPVKGGELSSAKAFLQLAHTLTEST